MKNGIWMVLFTAASLGLAACGGDANGSDEMEEMAETAETMAEEGAEAAGDMAEGATDMSQELPEGVTMAMVDEGKTVFEGAGICMSCHGPSGEGIPNLGGNLTDDAWLHSDGSYEAIVETVMNGVTAEASTSGVPMPARAGTNISDEQVRAAAAYVWTLSK
ncbi:MAG TPA: c-type cytochrome [Gemmatimonadota bacterium]|nr:c-type cytochrome [Gemmatimonadota bacterium]